MSKYYIGGVANVSAFQTDANGVLSHFFDAKTLTDSSINVSVSNEEIRGGEGAQLLGKFFHTTVFNLSLTDALFDLKYIATQVGSSVEYGETVIMKSYDVIDGKINTDGPVATLQFGSSNTNLFGWDKNDKTHNLTKGTTATQYIVADAADIDCLTVPLAKTGDQVKVKAMYTPGVMSLIMRAKLFAGDSCKASDGKAVGEVVIEVPKFQLDGTIDLAMAMTSPATYALNGSALANGCGCDDDMWYAKITDVIYADERDEFYGYNGIVIDANYLAAGETLGVYAFATGKTPKQLSASQYQSNNTSIVAENGVILDGVSGTVEITSIATYQAKYPNGATYTANSAIYGEKDSVFINTVHAENN